MLRQEVQEARRSGLSVSSPQGKTGRDAQGEDKGERKWLVPGNDSPQIFAIISAILVLYSSNLSTGNKSVFVTTKFKSGFRHVSLIR